MNLLKLLRQESALKFHRIALIAAIAGGSNALVLAIINAAAEESVNHEGNFRQLVMFIIVIFIYMVSQRSILVTSTANVEEVVHRIRLRLIGQVRRTDLNSLEHIGRAEIFASISKETTTITQAASTLINALQSGILIVFTMIYIGYLSMPAFFISIGFTLMAVWVFFYRMREVNAEIHQAMTFENRLFDTLTDVLDGFKETKISSSRARDLYADFTGLSSETARIKTRTHGTLANQFVYSQTMFFLLIGTMVFIAPKFGVTYTDVVTKTTAATLFMIGPIASFVSSIPLFSTASAAAENIVRLEKRLTEVGRDGREDDHDAELRDFETIALRGVVFRHTDEQGREGFVVGPLDLEIKSGETLFVTGGNGSGKSTMLRLLTRLYAPTKGSVLIDGREVTPDIAQSYRDLFSALFSDYHLFHKLYGLTAPSAKETASLLRLLEIDDKVRLTDGSFSTLDLSGGQRKRLALFVCMLEHKPVYVFDEFAADQDPTFRRKFYDELLPRLKREGATVIAVTHDDQYFDRCDRRVHMEDGRFVAPRTGGVRS
jgi:putative ATP-binding cassette transporter